MKLRKRGERREEVYVQSLVVADGASGLESVHLCVGGADIGRLKDEIRAAFQSALERHLRRREFGGEIRVVVLSEVTPQAPGVWRALVELEEQLKAVVAAGGLRTALGHPVRVGIDYTAREP